jgi:hypothetical protein
MFSAVPRKTKKKFSTFDKSKSREIFKLPDALSENCHEMKYESSRRAFQEKVQGENFPLFRNSLSKDYKNIKGDFESLVYHRAW